MNSPGTFAIVLGSSALALIAWGRLSALKMLATLAILGAIALTYVRSVWVALVLTLILVVLVTRGGAMKRMIPLAVALVVVAPVVVAGSTGAALSDRFNTFGALSSDESAQARQATPTALFPIAAGNPIGTGLGSAGEPSRLNTVGNVLRYPDNGYLSLIAQVGPVGFAVVISILFSAVSSAWRNAWRRKDGTDVLVFAVLAYMTLSLLAGDHLFGIGGMIIWYMAGLAVRRRELYEHPRTW
jgi:O-antigen ligase